MFQLIPISTPAFRGVLESLVPAALGAGLLAAWMCFIFGAITPISLAAAAITGTAWGVAPLLFSQAVIIEVHGLQSLIVVLMLWWITLNFQARETRHEKWQLLLSFLIGLGFGNHLTLLLFIPIALICLIYRGIQSRNWKLVVAQISLVVIGTLVYIYLPLRARAYPAINWGNPQNWSGFLWEVTANPYRGLLFGARNAALWERIRSIASLLLDQFGALGLVAGSIGVIQHSFQNRLLRGALVWTFVVYLAFAIGYNSEDSVGYLLPAVMVFAIWIGLAVPSIWNLNWKRIPFGILLVAILTLSIWARIPGSRARLDPRPQDQPARYAEQLMTEAPTDAIVYTTTDQDSFPLWYYHFGLHQRPDLRIIVLPLTQFVWYQQTLLHTYPDLTYPMLYLADQPNADWGKQIAQLNSGRPVCNSRLDSDSETGISFACSHP